MHPLPIIVNRVLPGDYYTQEIDLIAAIISRVSLSLCPYDGFCVDVIDTKINIE